MFCELFVEAFRFEQPQLDVGNMAELKQVTVMFLVSQT
jgi:hypothetical protein